MPELPEVEVVARGLARRLTRRRIQEVDLRRPDMVRGGHPELLELPIAGRRIERVQRAGKMVRIRLSGGISIYVHLGMTGRLVVASPRDPVELHTHLLMQFDNQHELRFSDPRRFGGIGAFAPTLQGAVKVDKTFA